MKVKNLNGTSDSPKCPCGNWLDHWKNYAHDDSPFCSVLSCPKEAEHGAHVQKTDGDRTWYIIPLCAKHNLQKGQEIEILDGTELVKATDRQECGL